jgi:putative ABC transport system substrate-binding protein
MKRRTFIAGLGSAAAWPVVARAQQATMPVVGYLGQWREESVLPAFRQGLGEAGYVEGRNVVIEYRWAEGRNDRLPALAADLVRRGVTVIATLDGTTGAVAAKAATTNIPIVFYLGVNPVELGLVTTLNRPGGNLTGVTSMNVELGPKRLEMLHGLVPIATTIAVLLNPTNPNSETQSRDLETAARFLGVQVQILQASAEHEIDLAFASLTHLRAGALLIGADVLFSQPIERVERIAALALRYAVPTIARNREFALAGGLMSYGGSGNDAAHIVGRYTGRILKGERASDLPVNQATKIELIINLKTAKALGLTIPETLLATADQVIE